MPRVVVGVACSGGLPFFPAAVPVPMTQETRSCPEQPMSFPALLLQRQRWGVFICSLAPLLAKAFT